MFQHYLIQGKKLYFFTEAGSCQVSLFALKSWPLNRLNREHASFQQITFPVTNELHEDILTMQKLEILQGYLTNWKVLIFTKLLIWVLI